MARADARRPSAAATDAHGPKMPGATALTMAHGTTPAAAPGPGSALAISTWPSSLAVATTRTPLAAQAAVNAAIHSGIGVFVGVRPAALLARLLACVHVLVPACAGLAQVRLGQAQPRVLGDSASRCWL